MTHNHTIRELSRNKDVFRQLLAHATEEEYRWKTAPEKWCLLEIVCHLYDEEREDFRARTKQVLENPEKPAPQIDPVGWVEKRKYMKQNYAEKLEQFLHERENSVEWLQSLQNPKWDNAFQHPKFGPMSANMFLSNWLAHDYLHIRQILRLKFDFLKKRSGESLVYAGEW